MPQPAITAYLSRLPKVKAQFKLEVSEAYRLMWMDKNGQKATIRRWSMLAFDEAKSLPGKVVSPAMLKMIGINVVLSGKNKD